jgi:hypothetical protein
MSKGHGIIQRHVLRELAEAAANTHSRDWVAVVEMGWSSSQEAVRRAMKRLAEEGYVELFLPPLHEYGERPTHSCGRITDKAPRLGRGLPNSGVGDGPMMIVLVLVLLGLLIVAGLIAFLRSGEEGRTW